MARILHTHGRRHTRQACLVRKATRQIRCHVEGQQTRIDVRSVFCQQYCALVISGNDHAGPPEGFGNRVQNAHTAFRWRLRAEWNCHATRNVLGPQEFALRGLRHDQNRYPPAAQGTNRRQSPIVPCGPSCTYEQRGDVGIGSCRAVSQRHGPIMAPAPTRSRVAK